MRRVALVFAVLLATGCALVAGLKDRDPPDDAGVANGNDATADAPDGSLPPADAADGASNDGAGGDGPAKDAGDAGPDARDAGPDAAEAGCVKGAPNVVVCGADASLACSDGCCPEAGVCGTISDCVMRFLTCDGPEDCPAAGQGCCATSGSKVLGSVCATCSPGAPTFCHGDCDCAADVPRCCPYPDLPQYGRCQATCP
jgi:hypothetical protein